MTVQQLKHEHQAKVDKLLTACQVFWAFNNKQFEEGKAKHPLKEGEKYVRIFGGGFIPSGEVENFKNGLSDIDRWYKQQNKDRKLRKQNILYELHNHEAFYVSSIEDTLLALGDDYTREEVQEVYNKEFKRLVKEDKI